MLAPLYALGLVGTVHVTDGAIAMGVMLAGLVWGYFVHANLRWRLGPLEWVVATPGFHHWRHTYGLQRNCNYASVLPWIDRLFGSHYLPKVWPSPLQAKRVSAPDSQRPAPIALDANGSADAHWTASESQLRLFNLRSFT